MAGESLPQAEPTAPHYLSLAADHGVHVEISPRVGTHGRRNSGADESGDCVSRRGAGAGTRCAYIRRRSTSTRCRDNRVCGVTIVWVPARAELVSAVCRCPQRRRRRAGHAAEAGQRCRQLVSARAGDVQAGVPVRPPAPHPAARHRRAGQADPRKSPPWIGRVCFALLAGALEGVEPALSGRRSIRSDRPSTDVPCDGPRSWTREPRSSNTLLEC